MELSDTAINIVNLAPIPVNIEHYTSHIQKIISLVHFFRWKMGHWSFPMVRCEIGEWEKRDHFIQVSMFITKGLGCFMGKKEQGHFISVFKWLVMFMRSKTSSAVRLMTKWKIHVSTVTRVSCHAVPLPIGSSSKGENFNTVTKGISERRWRGSCCISCISHISQQWPCMGL